jgi:hypothetical protein
MNFLDSASGKQLPVNVAFGIVAVNSERDSRDDGNKAVTWRLHDAAVALQRERHAQYLAGLRTHDSDSSNSSSSDPDDLESGDRMEPKLPMRLSSHFDQTVWHRLGHKEHIIRQAFHEAASAVLRAIQNPPPPDPATADTAWQQDLPLSLKCSAQGNPLTPANALTNSNRFATLEELRSYCLERSLENKEYMKRKGGKVDTKDTSTTHAKSSAKQQPAKKAPAKKKPSSTNSTQLAPVISTTVTAAVEPVMAQSSAAMSTAQTPVATNAPIPPKFTRNTPASSAASLDQRLNNSRAILCVAGNIVFDRLTPANPSSSPAVPFNVLDVPQNTKSTAASGKPGDSADSDVNMGAVLIEAQTLAQRTISVVENALLRAKQRYQYRKDNVRFDVHHDRDYLRIPNPFGVGPPNAVSDSEDDDGNEASAATTEDVPFQPNPDSNTVTWQTVCLPHFLAILATGTGHAIYHDSEWSSRHGRLADVLRSLATSTFSMTDDGNFGPHLIVTTEPELGRFAQEFASLSDGLRLVIRNESKSLRALTYSGTRSKRRRLRQYFSQASGLPEAPFHILITSYKYFLEDYLHFCQLPFESVILDEGVAWMATRDQNSLGTIWDSAIFSSNDHHIGLAGTSFKKWDYLVDEIPDTMIKDAWIGLTTRHRIVTASTFALKQRSTTELLAVSAMLDFVAPQFSAVVKEEWDRSKITASVASMNHFRKLLARSVVVHSPESAGQDMHSLASQAISGDLLPPDHWSEPLPEVPTVVSDDDFVTIGKVAFSRRSTLQWLGPPNQSWLRYELGCADFQPILDAAKISVNHGHFCEEITTASSTTASGATGQVAGTMAYRFAIRCARHFGSEPGLRQHLSAQHAPPGTWLCRTCFSDCITSQARTHHERTCGQLINGTYQVAAHMGDPLFANVSARLIYHT